MPPYSYCRRFIHHVSGFWNDLVLLTVVVDTSNVLTHKLELSDKQIAAHDAEGVTAHERTSIPSLNS